MLTVENKNKTKLKTYVDENYSHIFCIECFLICTSFCLDTQAQLASKGKDEVGSIVSSKLRRQAASLLSETDVKYAGKKSSRKQIFEQHPGKNDLFLFYLSEQDSYDKH